MKKIKVTTSILIILFSYFISHGQGVNLSSMAAPPAEEPVSLFLHLDKTIYQPGETIWLTGYVLNRLETVMEEQNTLYVLLIDAVKKGAVLRQRFEIRQGIGKANISLPGTLNGGDYWLIGYTNSWLKNDQQPIFRQLISVRSPSGTPFRILARSLEKTMTADVMYAHYRIGTSYGGLASGGEFAYTLFSGYDSLGSGKLRIDPFGEVVIPFAAQLMSLGKPIELTATVTRDSLIQPFILPISQSPEIQPSPEPMATCKQVSRKVTITTDSTEYHKRSLITLHIQVSDSLDEPLPALFSLSVTSARQLDWARTANILNARANQELLPEANKQSQITDAAFLNHFGISGPAEEGEMTDMTIPDDRLTTDPNKPDYGFVLYKGKQPRKSVKLLVMGDVFAPLESDPTGNFSLSYSMLLASPGSSNYISVTDNAVDQYKIIVHSRTDSLDNHYANAHYPLNFIPASVTSADSADAPTRSSLDLLKAAVVKAKIVDGYNPLTGEYRSTHCDHDFVANHSSAGGKPFRILNSPYDLTGSRPVEGERYQYIDADDDMGAASLNRDSDGSRRVGMYRYTKTIVYHCAVSPTPPFMTNLQPIIRTPKPFPLQDYSTNNTSTLGSGLQSTVYWNYLTSTDEKGEATISFYTNDLTGTFTCILQGLSAKGVVCGKSSYKIIP